MTSIRGKLLLAFTALALIAVAGMALGGWAVLRSRAVAQARAAFGRAHTTLERSLQERYKVFTQIANLSYIDPVIRAVAGGATDEADFGLRSAAADRKALEKLHANLVDANWDWSAAAGEGSFAVLDYKGRVLYANSAPATWGGEAGTLPAVIEALGDGVGHVGSMVLPAEDPRVGALGLARPGTTGVLLVMARAEVLRGKPQAVFLQIIGARKLMGAVAATEGTQVTLVTDDGATDGTVPPAAVAAAGVEPVTVATAGSTWLAQAYALPGPGSGRRIGTIVVAHDLGAELGRLIDPAVVPLVLIALALQAAALVVAFVLAARFTRPIVALEAAAQRVAAGDLAARVGGRTGGDEIARLGRAFDSMVDGLRERERIKRTFKKYLAPDVVDYLLAHPEAQELGGTRRELTVMFSDIVHFTEMAEARAPEEVVAILNRYYTQVAEQIVARGGTVDKYIGDAVMSFFGAPVPRPDHAGRACLAALDHLAVVDTLDLEVRIGINTGEMILGNIGGGGQQDYTVIGDAVNLAQRIEGANRDYGTRLLVTEAVARHAGDAVETREIDSLIVLGRGAPVTVHEVLGPAGWRAAHPERARALEAYADGLRAFRERRFADAAAAFRSAPDDGPSRTMLARAEAFAVAPPPADWDGAFRKLAK